MSGAAEVLLFSLSFVLGIAVPAGIVRGDLARLQGERLARSWPDASVWAAVVAFGPLCVPVHFIRTRRSLVGIALGLAWLIAALLLIVLPVELLGSVLGVAP
jgi:hypothetical protein